jgi:hypothetical protein
LLKDYIIEKTKDIGGDHGTKNKNKKGIFKNLMSDDSERYIVEYTYIDFEYMIIGEKIKHIDQ